ncbi:MAG: beta-lactamase family protein [Acidobacteria bacterium]|nr:beta-lactamase family protein [Acidobacteriota bacterium]
MLTIRKPSDPSLVVLGLAPTLAALILATGSASAQIVTPTNERLTELDRRIEDYMEKNHIPGVLVAVASKGRMIHLKPYGMANVELSVPVSETTVFEIGSISKQFVSSAAMMLVEEGRLGLDDQIHAHLPFLPGEWRGVTVRQLMTHTSGIPDYEEIATYDIYGFRLTPEEVIRIAHSRPMDFEPGTAWNYSNTGYFLLSMIVEGVEGKPLGEVLEDRIFEPVGMTRTRMADPETIIPDRAAGYWVDKSGELINRRPTETSSTLGAGGLLSTASDLAKWDAALYGENVLSNESKRQMWTGAVLLDGNDTKYGFGWDVTPYRELTRQQHGGMVAGFVARFSRFPDQEAVFIVLMNRYEVTTFPIFKALVHTFMPSLGPIPE